MRHRDVKRLVPDWLLARAILDCRLVHERFDPARLALLEHDEGVHLTEHLRVDEDLGTVAVHGQLAVGDFGVE